MKTTKQQPWHGKIEDIAVSYEEVGVSYVKQKNQEQINNTLENKQGVDRR